MTQSTQDSRNTAGTHNAQSTHWSRMGRAARWLGGVIVVAVVTALASWIITSCTRQSTPPSLSIDLTPNAEFVIDQNVSVDVDGDVADGQAIWTLIRREDDGWWWPQPCRYDGGGRAECQVLIGAQLPAGAKLELLAVIVDRDDNDDLERAREAGGFAGNYRDLIAPVATSGSVPVSFRGAPSATGPDPSAGPISGTPTDTQPSDGTNDPVAGNGTTVSCPSTVVEQAEVDANPDVPRVGQRLDAVLNIFFVGESDRDGIRLFVKSGDAYYLQGAPSHSADENGSHFVFHQVVLGRPGTGLDLGAYTLVTVGLQGTAKTEFLAAVERGDWTSGRGQLPPGSTPLKQGTVRRVC